MLNKFKKLLFDIWMNENHPWFYTIAGLVGIVLIVLFLISLTLLLFDIHWWWKLLVVTIVLAIGYKWVIRALLIKYKDEFERRS